MAFTVTCGSFSVELPNPQLGDSLVFNTNAIKRRLRLGQFETFKDDDWPELTSYKYKFYPVDGTQRDDLINLLENKQGLQYTIVDHIGETRVGFINPATVEFIEIHTGECSYELSFTFVEDTTPP